MLSLVVCCGCCCLCCACVVIGCSLVWLMFYCRCRDCCVLAVVVYHCASSVVDVRCALLSRWSVVDCLSLSVDLVLLSIVGCLLRLVAVFVVVVCCSLLLPVVVLNVWCMSLLACFCLFVGVVVCCKVCVLL